MPVSLLYSKLHMQLSILQLTPSGQTFGLKLNLWYIQLSFLLSFSSSIITNCLLPQ